MTQHIASVDAGNGISWSMMGRSPSNSRRTGNPASGRKALEQQRACIDSNPADNQADFDLLIADGIDSVLRRGLTC